MHNVNYKELLELRSAIFKLWIDDCLNKDLDDLKDRINKLTQIEVKYE